MNILVIILKQKEEVFLKTFEKLHAAGNDFILFDFSEGETFQLDETLIKKICHRQMGVGADGVIVLDFYERENKKLNIKLFNSDGSESKMCANGTRCAVYFQAKKMHLQSIKVETLSGVYESKIKEDEVWLSMGIDHFKDEKIDFKKLECAFKFDQFYFADSGVPHSIFVVKNVKDLNIAELSPSIRHHKIFTKGCNVNFVERLSGNEFFVRTFERGVEDETLSCGTGILAISYSLKKHEGLSGNMQFQTKGGLLKSQIENNSISYGGKVISVFSGQLHF